MELGTEGLCVNHLPVTWSRVRQIKQSYCKHYRSLIHSGIFRLAVKPNTQLLICRQKRNPQKEKGKLIDVSSTQSGTPEK